MDGLVARDMGVISKTRIVTIPCALGATLAVLAPTEQRYALVEWTLNGVVESWRREFKDNEQRTLTVAAVATT